MKRRQFLGASSIGAAGLLGLGPNLISAQNAKANWVMPSSGKSMKVGTQRSPLTREMLQFMKRHGADYCVGYPKLTDERRWTVAAIQEQVERAAEEGITVQMLFMPLTSSWGQQRRMSMDDRPSDKEGRMFTNLMQENDERDRELDLVCNMIQKPPRRVFTASKYSHRLIIGGKRTGTVPWRGGSEATAWDWSKVDRNAPPDYEEIITHDKFWDCSEYFLNRIMPVARENNVRLCIHPFDPPWPQDVIYRGTASSLGSPDGLKRYLEIAGDGHGLVFCVGTVGQMLENPHDEICPIVKHFAECGQIDLIHFRNIKGGLNKFNETYPDDGDMDFWEVMKTLVNANYTRMIVPDHMPRHPDDNNGGLPFQAYAFGLGYMKALIQAAEAERDGAQQIV